MCEEKSLKDRLTGALILGAIFLALSALPFGINYPHVDATGMLLTASSPIYIWRYLQCHDDPVWLLMAQAVLPYFVYGAAFGYFLPRCRLTVKYAVIVAICFCFAVAGSVLIIFFSPQFNSCDVPSQRN